MVWDTALRRVAGVDDTPAFGISEEAAKRFAEILNDQTQDDRCQGQNVRVRDFGERQDRTYFRSS
jgi:hypothetical protein